MQRLQQQQQLVKTIAMQGLAPVLVDESDEGAKCERWAGQQLNFFDTLRQLGPGSTSGYSLDRLQLLNLSRNRLASLSPITSCVLPLSSRSDGR